MNTPDDAKCYLFDYDTRRLQHNDNNNTTTTTSLAFSCSHYLYYETGVVDAPRVTLTKLLADLPRGDLSVAY